MSKPIPQPYSPEAGGLQLLEDGPPELQITFGARVAFAAKWLLDFIGSVVCLILLVPVFLVIGIAIKIESPGPVFFVHRRLGRNGRHFDCVKFRSMRRGAENELYDWSAEKNREVFGSCSNPSYHGHTYTCAVEVTAAVDKKTGMLVDLAKLDRVLEEEVKQRFDHRNINLDIPEFADGKLVPTGENLARFIYDRVQSALGKAVTVSRVTVAEDATLSATYVPD